MGLLPEKEPVKNKYENPTEITPLSIERKEVITPVPTQFKVKVTDDKGNNLTQSTDDTKYKIVIPQTNKNQMEEDLKKGDIEDSTIWSVGYWLRIFKKAIFFGWKVIFDKGK